ASARMARPPPRRADSPNGVSASSPHLPPGRLMGPEASTPPGPSCLCVSFGAMANFQGLDFLRLDELLSDEERLARDTVREWVTREFLPVIQEHVRKDGSFPLELVPAVPP